MKPIIITKKQAKFARYLAVRWLGKPGRYARVRSIEKTREFFNEDGDGAAWSEREVPNDSASVEVNVYTVKGPALSYGFLGQALSLLGLTRYDQTDHIANPIPPKTGPVPPELQPPPHHDVADAVALAVSFQAQPAEPAKPEIKVVKSEIKDLSEDGTLTVDVQAVIPQTADSVNVAVKVDPVETTPVAAPMPLRDKLSKCATMRLAHKFGMDPSTEFGDIVKAQGDAAVISYQEILSKVPAYGLTEARLKFAFPAEYALL